LLTTEYIFMRILFVDDVSDTRFIFRTALEVAGHEVRLAANGAEAVRLFGAEIFDAVIMDASMPEMDGWEATGLIRALPRGQQVPIVIFTAHFRRGVEDRARQAGADALVEKPMLPAELRELVERLVAERQAGNLTEQS
jgi:two-component system sensor histidine kinase/response regulator